MAKRKRKIDGNGNAKKINEKRGIGNFDEYKPWLTIQDVASIGQVTRIKGIKSGRIHHLLSTLELNYFYLLDWSEEVIDIREQYPLDLRETVAIAKEFGLSHPPQNAPLNPIVRWFTKSREETVFDKISQICGKNTMMNLSAMP